MLMLLSTLCVLIKTLKHHLSSRLIITIFKKRIESLPVACANHDYIGLLLHDAQMTKRIIALCQAPVKDKRNSQDTTMRTSFHIRPNHSLSTNKRATASLTHLTKWWFLLDMLIFHLCMLTDWIEPSGPEQAYPNKFTLEHETKQIITLYRQSKSTHEGLSRAVITRHDTTTLRSVWEIQRGYTRGTSTSISYLKLGSTTTLHPLHTTWEQKHTKRLGNHNTKPQRVLHYTSLARHPYKIWWYKIRWCVVSSNESSSSHVRAWIDSILELIFWLFLSSFITPSYTVATARPVL